MAGDIDTAGAELSGSTNNGSSLSSSSLVGSRLSEGEGTPAGPQVESSDADSLSDAGDEEQAPQPDAPPKRSRPSARWAIVLGLIASVVLAALIGWQGYVGHRLDQDQQRRGLIIQAATQGALNLTTLDWEHADADVQRIVESATGAFYDDFSRRMQPFVEVLKKAKSKSVGTVTEAGLESEADGKADVLLAVRIDTTNAGAPEQEPRHWRMRLSVEDVDGQLKISNVAFVP